MSQEIRRQLLAPRPRFRYLVNPCEVCGEQSGIGMGVFIRLDQWSILKANSHMPCRAHVAPIPRPCRAYVVTLPYRAAPLPFSDSAVFFVEIRVVAGRGWTRVGRPHTVYGRPILIHTYHATPMPRPCRAVQWTLEVAFRTARARHGMFESNTAALCKANGEDTTRINS
jgi:hypothetical protein